MRTKEEIGALIDKLRRFNSCLNAQIAAGDDEAMCAFNSNSTMLCALQWVMGEDTIR